MLMNNYTEDLSLARAICHEAKFPCISYVHTTPEELYSKNASISSFRNLVPRAFPERGWCFRCTLPRIGNLKNSRITGCMFGFVFRKNSGREVTWRHRFQSGFRPENEKPASSNWFLRFEGHFRDGLRMMGLTVEIKMCLKFLLCSVDAARAKNEFETHLWKWFELRKLWSR